MSETKKDPRQKHWLVRPQTIRLLSVGGIVLLIAVTLLDFTLAHPHAYFGIDGSFGFYSWFGLVSCALMVLSAKLLGFILKRPDTHYDDKGE